MKIVTIISNYNEEGSIKKTIEDFKNNSSIKSDLLVIDNCSSDKSIILIKESKVDYLQHTVNSGGSEGVIKTALLYAHLNDYDIYCHMDGDNQHNSSELSKIVQPIIDKSADIVIGSRFITKKGFQSYFIRRVAINIFSYLVSIVTRQKITDLTSGFRAYNKKAISFFAGQYKHELEVCVQMLMVASYAGLFIKEVPVIMNPRRTGKSQFSFKGAVKFPVFVFISFIGTILQKGNIRRLSNANKL